MKIKYFLLMAFVLFIQVATAQTSAKELAYKVANAYGIESFKKAKTLAYTFNIKRDTFPVSYRSWNWDMANNVVTMTTAKQTITYKRDTISTKEMKSVDGRFINDQYWLIFPYHVVMDAGTTLSVKENVIAPISKSNTSMLTVQYNKVDGYTPGDAYDLYIDNNNTIVEWVYRSGGAEKPSLITTWQDNKMNAGVKTATNFKSEDGKFNIYFTNIAVK